VVGVGTVLADDCRLTVRAVAGPDPVRVVLDPAARAPLTAQVFSDAGPGALWLVAEDASVPDDLPAQVEVVRLPRGADGAFRPVGVVAVLAERGLGRVLVEGGGVTVSRFLAAGALDRLLVTTAPVLVGDGVPGIRFEGRERIAEALRPPARRFALGHDSCVELDLSRR
jgi:riboflavin biosynthesis pyrimidine reductase